MWKDTLRKAPFSGRKRQQQYQTRDANNQKRLKRDFPRKLENLFDDIYDTAISRRPNESYYQLSMPQGLANYIQEMLNAGITHYEITDILRTEYDAAKVHMNLEEGRYGKIGIGMR